MRLIHECDVRRDGSFMRLEETNRVLSFEKNHQLYVIQWNLKEAAEVEIGKLSTALFPKGVYVYIGSAKKNIETRVNRHLKIEKKKRWHMDYLRPYVTPLGLA